MMNHRKIDENDLEKPKLMNRAFNIIKSILNGVIISGIIIFMIGLYYLIIKAVVHIRIRQRNFEFSTQSIWVSGKRLLEMDF